MNKLTLKTKNLQDDIVLADIASWFEVRMQQLNQGVILEMSNKINKIGIITGQT